MEGYLMRNVGMYQKVAHKKCRDVQEMYGCTGRYIAVEKCRNVPERI